MSDFITVYPNGNILEYYDAEHMYLVNGVIVPSVTQVMKVKFGRKYDGVDKDVLKRASDAGIAVHSAIQKYCETGEIDDFPEVRNFCFLEDKYGFDVIGNEVPVIMWDGLNPVCAGRLDLVLEMNGVTGLADIKRTVTLDKEYLCYQLNLYRIAYQQTYGKEIKFIKGIHLRENTRKFVNIPINEECAWEIVREYEQSNN